MRNELEHREELRLKWAFDVYHSSVTFTIRHMMSKVRGQMQIKEGWIEVDNDNLSTAKVDVVLDAATINTGVEMRDNHLRSADGNFDVANYPTITFKSKRVEGKDPSSFKGEGKDPWGNRRVSFSAETKLNRKDFDLTWNQALEAGGFLLGDDVKLEIDLEAVPAQTPAEAEKEIEAEAALESR